MITDISNKLTGTLRLGTRGSLLALHQTHLVKIALEKRYSAQALTCRPVIIKTRGDRAAQTISDSNETVGAFTKELEEALLHNEIDIAVHSLKDLPAELSAGLILGAVLPREDCRDVLISRYGLTLREMTERKKDSLYSVTCLATSSLRRKAQLLYFCKDFRIKDIGGNVDTRLRKMESGYCDALVLAGAGIKRIGMEHRITEYLEPEICMPAASQGIIGLEIREDNTLLHELLTGINHPETMLCARAEREFLKAIQGSCKLPLGCIGRVENEQFKLTGVFAHPEGEYVIKSTLSGPSGAGEELARELAAELMRQGGAELLKLIKASL
jgi:hydroxymethylbilane synthase